MIAGQTFIAASGETLRIMRVEGDDATSPVLVEHPDGQQVLLTVGQIRRFMPEPAGPSCNLNEAPEQDAVTIEREPAPVVEPPKPEPIEQPEPAPVIHTPIADATSDRWVIAKAIYDHDATDVDGKGDVLPPEEWNKRDFVAAPFGEAHPEVQGLYLRRAAAVAARIEPRLNVVLT